MHICYFCGYFEKIEAFALSLALENLHFQNEPKMRSWNAHTTGMGSLLVGAIGRANPSRAISWDPCL